MSTNVRKRQIEELELVEGRKRLSKEIVMILRGLNLLGLHALNNKRDVAELGHLITIGAGPSGWSRQDPISKIKNTSIRPLPKGLNPWSLRWHP
jgi:hypothetical protein